MILPTIHLNGTPKADLIAKLCEASQSLDLAYSALKQTYPNGRDYYPQGPTVINGAMDEHSDLMRRLDAIKKEVDQRMMAIDELE